MVNRVFSILKKEVSGLHEAAFLLGFFALSSQVLALVRDRLLAHYFGAGRELDVYYAAFKIPDLLYTGIASFVSITVLIPFLSRFLTENGDSERRARDFMGSVFAAFLAVMALFAAIAFMLMPRLSGLVAPGFSSADKDTLVLLSRILLLSPFLLGVSNLFGSITQLERKFFVYALSPVLYNVGIISGVVFFYPVFGVSGLAWGVILGAVLHMAIQLPVVSTSDFYPKMPRRIDWSAVREVAALSLPRTIGLSTSLLALIGITAIASFVSKGSIAVFNLSFNLQSVPLSIVGVSYSLAAFPTLAGMFSRGERERFSSHIIETLRHIIFWSLPITALFIVLRAQIVRVILGSGYFSWTDTRLTAAALALFVLSLVAQSIILVLVRGFYAAGETKIPVLINIFSAVFIVVSSLALLSVFDKNLLFRYFMESLFRVDGIKGTAILMLPLAYSLGNILNMIFLWRFFRTRYADKGVAELRRTFFEGFASAVFIGFVSYLCLTVFGKVFNLNTFTGILMQGAFSGLIGVLFGVYLLKLLRSKELSAVSAALRSRFWKEEVIAPEMTEL